MIYPYITQHAEMRMLNRHISHDEVLECINLGFVKPQLTPPNTFVCLYKGLKIVVGEHGVITAFRYKTHA